MMSENIDISVEVLCPGLPSVKAPLRLAFGRMRVGELLRSCIAENTAARLGCSQNESASFSLNEQYELAIKALTKRQILLFVDGVNVTDLEREIQIHAETEVLFLRLVALEGG